MGDLSLYEFRQILDSEANLIVKQKDLDNRKNINNGECSLFARSVRDTIRSRFGNKYLTQGKNNNAPRVYQHTYGVRDLVSSSHVWLEFRELHFDAECIEGVRSPQELPIFKRNDISESQIKKY